MPRRPVDQPVKKKAVKPAPAPAGYSGTPLPKKLGVDGDRSVLLMNAPMGFEDLIRDDSGMQRIKRGRSGSADVVIWFVKNRGELDDGLDRAIAAMAEGGGLWIAWPKKASGIVTDVSEDVVRETGLAAGIVDYKVCAIDATWSGHKFARRKR